jgi:2,4-dienoyl-CoA reductase-like NADH-dependent reductase (Old Yellow Enzyme family)
MALVTGEVTDPIIKRYRRLARGEVGLIIPGYMYVHPYGKGVLYQTGIHSDDMISGLQALVEAVHEEGGKVVFQLHHAGRQTRKDLIGKHPKGPSSEGRDPMFFIKPEVMTEMELTEVIESFGKAAERAVKAGADGVQIHAAHGYLVNQFLSPFFNRRNDEWGGSDEKRFRFLKEVILAIRNKIPGGMPLLIKLNTNDYTPKEGITPELAVKYTEWLADLEIDLIEVSCGSMFYSVFNIIRGDVPVKTLLNLYPWWMKPLANLALKSKSGKFDLEEGYNLDAAKMIRGKSGNIAISVVGGFRKLKHMEEVVEEGFSDFISMCRPFIREPYIVKKFKEGKKEEVDCKSCNECLGNVGINHPLRCYSNGSSEDE